MRTNPWRKTSRRLPGEAGQAMLFVLLALGLFLLGAVAFAVDMGWLWFHRQAAQTAADAACTAGAMDILVDAQGGATGKQGFTVGTAFYCSASPTASPCVYAALNGYDGKNTSPGNDIRVTFPPRTSPPPGVTAPPSAVAGTYPFMQVDVTDHVKTFFYGLLSGSNTLDVRAGAVCGVVLAQSPIPILVLDPQNPSSGSALSVQGTPVVAIVGGPSKSIQVNSSATTAVNIQGSATVDLSKGGPAQTGSDLGAYGGPAAAPGGFLPGTTGHWNSPASPISDPFAQVCAPGQTGCALINGNSAPAKPGAPQVPADEKATGKFPLSPCLAIPCSVGWKDHGCPETTAVRGDGRCKLYTPGLYDSTTGFGTGISVGPGGAGVGSTGVTALFDPGLYYVAGGLALNSNSTARPGTGLGDGSGGVVFYFSGSGTITVAADSGSKVKDPFNTMTGPHDRSGVAYPNDATHTNVTYTNGVRCTAASTVPANLQGAGGAGVDIGTDPSGNATGANLLFGACTGYYGDPAGTSDPLGEQHGFLLFQDRSATSVNPNWSGGGQFLLSGTMYFHSCNATGTGVGCGAAGTYFTDRFTLEGNPGSGTYVLGDIIVDNLILKGTSGVTMDLNPNAAYSVLKATLLQ